MVASVKAPKGRKASQACEASPANDSTALVTVGPVAPAATGRCDVRATKRDLARVLGVLSAVADSKSTMPILGCIGMRASAEGVTFTATDLNVSATCIAPAWCGGENGSLAIPVKRFASVVKRLPEGTVQIRAKDQRALVACGSVATDLDALHARDFPKIPAPSDEIRWEQRSASGFLAALQSVRHAVCHDETRFHLNGVYLDASGRCTVATDGHRLSKRECLLNLEHLATGIIIPDRAIHVLGKVIAKGSSETCSLGYEKHVLFVRVGAWEIAIKCIDAQFPPYEQVIPRDNARLVTVERDALVAAAHRALALTSETRGMAIELTPDGLVLSADDPDTGKMRETLACECAASSIGVKIGVNPRYMLDALAVIDDGRVTMALAGDLDPMLVRSMTDAVTTLPLASGFLAVIMPMRV